MLLNNTILLNLILTVHVDHSSTTSHPKGIFRMYKNMAADRKLVINYRYVSGSHFETMNVDF